MRKRKRKLAVALTVGIAVIIFLLAAITATTGYREFTAVLERQYNDTAYEIAETALTYLNPDKFEEYLKTGQTDSDYERIQARLDALVVSGSCNFIYVAKIDDSDYMTTTYIYDAVNPATGFDRYELGFRQQDMDPQYMEELKHILDTGGRAEKYLYSYSESGAHTTAGLAVKDSHGNIVAVLGVEKAMTVLENARSAYVRHVALIAAIVTVAAFTVYFLWLNHMLIRPVAEITMEAKRFADNSDKPAEILTALNNPYEIGVLAVSVQKMEFDIKKYIENLTLVTAEKERIGAELDVAADIQKSMLPCIFPAFPEREEADIYATMKPAKEVGGDFYDFFMVDEGHLAIVMADVSGKGVPAALFMVIGKTLIKDHTRPGRNLGEVFTEVNKLLCESNSEGLFITAFEGVLDLVTGEFRYVNAGHEMPFIQRAEGSFEVYEISPGFVLAGLEDMRYEEGSLILQEGDKLFQYTDGVTEATNHRNELFGRERLKAALNRGRDKSICDILETVKESIDAFAGTAPQFDDITMLCMEFKLRMPENNYKNGAQLTVAATVQNMERVADFVDGQLEAMGCAKEVRIPIAIAVDELFANIAFYAYRTDTGSVIIRVERQGTPLRAVVTFIDTGIPYNPLDRKDPDTGLTVEERGIGGLGIYIVKKSMDNVTYEYKDGQNILKIEKRIECEYGRQETEPEGMD